MKPLQPKRKGRLPWRFIPAIILALVFLVFLIWRVHLHFELKSKIAALQAAGLPTSGAELNDWLFSIEPHENGALVLTRAFTLLDTSQAILTRSARPGLIKTNTWPPEIRTRVHAYLQTNALALAAIDRALTFPRFHFPIDYTAGFATELPQLRLSKETAVLLSLRTALAAEEERTNQWPEFLERQIRFGEALNDEPTVIGFLVRSACLQIAINTAERSLRYSPPNIAACQRLSAAFLQAAETNLLPRAFIAERAITMPIFREVPHFSDSTGEDDATPPPTTLPRRYDLFYRVIGFFERDMNFYLDSMAPAIDLAREPAPANLVLTNHFENIRTQARSRFYLFTGMALPALGRVAVRQAIVQANLRIAATAFAIETFRQTNGALPTALKQLTPAFLKEVPLDPFDARPLRYSLLPSGYRLYSVGPDDKDDGGLPEPKRKRPLTRPNYDLVFSVSEEPPNLLPN